MSQRLLATVPRVFLAVSMLLVIPGTALAHNGVNHGSLSDPRVLLGLDASDPLPNAARVPTAADLRADPARRSVRSSDKLRCRATVAVAGLGRSCRTVDGLWRVHLGSGGSVVTHGPDEIGALKVLHARLERQQARRMKTARGRIAARSFASPTKTDISCISSPASEAHFRVLYVRPSGAPDRSAAMVPALRTQVYKMSAFLNDEAFRVSGVTRKLRVRCDGSGEAEVTSVVTPTSAGSDSFSSVLTDLTSLGYINSSPANMLVYYDGYNESSPSAGTGSWPGDDRATTDNWALDGGNLAVEWNYVGSGATPHWSTLLHEAGHNMGAVADSAPNTSGAGHCNDGLDVMCYDDGGPNSGSFSNGVCAVEQFDCNANDFYNPTPAGGSYLATHWNLAHTRNEYLDSAQASDVTPPTAPGTPTVTARTAVSVSLSWTASTDDTYVAGYRLYRSTGGGGFSLVKSVPPSSTITTDTGLTLGTTYTYRLTAWDGTNESAASGTVDGVPADTVAPTRPGGVAAALAGVGAANMSWLAASDDQGVTGYSVQRWVSGNTWNDFVATGATSASLTGLSGTEFFAVVAVDAAGNRSARSDWVQIDTADTGRDQTGSADMPVTNLRVMRASPRTFELAWDLPAGATDATRFDILVNGRSVGLATGTRFTVRSLAPSRAYIIGVSTIQNDNASGLSEISAKTTKDSVSPSTPLKLAVKRSRKGVSISWRAATDPDAGRVTYRVQSKRGKGKWKAVTKTKATRITMRGVAKGTFIRIIASDDAGNVSAPSKATRLR